MKRGLMKPVPVPKPGALSPESLMLADMLWQAGIPAKLKTGKKGDSTILLAEAGLRIEVDRNDSQAAKKWQEFLNNICSLTGDSRLCIPSSIIQSQKRMVANLIGAAYSARLRSYEDGYPE